MTEHTPVPIKIEWEPIIEGILLWMNEKPSEYDDMSFHLPMSNVRELRDDMMEAYMMARGYEKHDHITAVELDKGWIIYVADNQFRIASTFIELRSKYEGVWYCLQDDEGREIILPAEQLLTGWSPVE